MKFRIDLKILVFLVIFYITHQLKLYILIMIFCLIHEVAHSIVGLSLGFKIQEIELMPCGFFIKVKAQIRDYNKKILKSNIVELKKIFVILAGPIMNIVLIAVFMNVDFTFVNSQIAIYANLTIFLFNLIPIYPLDGGRILKSIIKLLAGARIANICTNKISNLFMILLTFVSSILILYLENISILFILIYLWLLVIDENKRFEIQQKIYKLDKRI